MKAFGVEINLAELAAVIWAIAAVITAIKGRKALEKKNKEKNDVNSEV